MLLKHRTQAHDQNVLYTSSSSEKINSRKLEPSRFSTFEFEDTNHKHTTECGCLPVYERHSVNNLIQTIEDFMVVKVIGKGTFGKVKILIVLVLTQVYLVVCKHTGKLYAMKSIRKDAVIEHQTIEKVSIEKLILLQVNHPFIINMEYVFIKEYRIYFLMDYIS